MADVEGPGVFSCIHCGGYKCRTYNFDGTVIVWLDPEPDPSGAYVLAPGIALGNEPIFLLNVPAAGLPRDTIGPNPVRYRAHACTQTVAVEQLPWAGPIGLLDCGTLAAIACLPDDDDAAAGGQR